VTHPDVDQVDAVHLVRMDVAADATAAFDEWYRDRFLPLALTSSPWLRATVYACTAGSPGFLVLLRGRIGPGHDKGLAVPPFPWEGEYGPATIHNYEGETYTLVQEAGHPNPREELINLITTEVRPTHAAEFDRWYRDRHVPDILGCPGWLWVQRFRSIDREGRFLAVYGISDEDRPFSSPEYDGAVGWESHVDSLLGFHGFRIYRRRYAVDADSASPPAQPA
jgi:hypothetical protein